MDWPPIPGSKNHSVKRRIKTRMFNNIFDICASSMKGQHCKKLSYRDWVPLLRWIVSGWIVEHITIRKVCGRTHNTDFSCSWWLLAASARLFWLSVSDCAAACVWSAHDVQTLPAALVLSGLFSFQGTGSHSGHSALQYFIILPQKLGDFLTTPSLLCWEYLSFL